MATRRQVTTDYTGGLQGAHLRGRLDIEKFSKGLQRMENFLPSVQGPATFRPGTQYVRDEASGRVRLIDFSINNANRYLIAVSSTDTGGVINIYNRDGNLLYTRTVDSDNDPLPWTGNEIDDLRWSREVDKMVFTHPKYRPYILSANTVFEQVRLYSTEGWTVTQDGDADKITGDYVINGTANGFNKFEFTNADTHLIILRNDGAGNWEFYNNDTAATLFTVAEGTYESKIPTSGWAADTGVGSNPTLATTQGSKLGLNDEDGNNLYGGSIGSEGLTPWTFEKMSFTSHPFQRTDTSDTVMSLVPGSVEEVIRLESDAADFSGLPANLETTKRYVEYKTRNQWGLARIIDSNYDAAYPDPTSTVCYAIPVDKVVNVEDPSVRLALINNDDGSGGSTTDADWMEEDGVPREKAHVRADALIFQTSNIGGWVRIGGDKLFTQVCEPDADAAYNSTDGNVRWAQITDYRGVEDHPVEFVYGTYAAEEFESGSIYQVYEWGGSILGLISFDGTGKDRDHDLAAAVRKTGGTPRFAMNHDLYTYTTLADDTSGWGGEAKGTTSAGAITANMSTQKQFDVCEVDSTTIREEGTDLIVPTGNVSVYDLTNDPEGIAVHTGTIRTSRSFFSETRDSGRYILGNMTDKWVLFQVASWSSDTQVTVDILSSVPRDALTGDLTNNGVFLGFRMGAWYTGNWPYAVAYYEQRRVFAGSNFDPNKVWFSKLTDDTDFRTVEDDGETLDTTGITYPLGTSSTIIRWLESGPTLVIGTESNEWQLRPNEFTSAITPKNIRITQETPIGSIIQGRRVGSSVFFPHISGRNLIQFRYDFQSQQFVTNDTTKLVPLLFESDPIVDTSYQLNPLSCFWIVTESGKLFTLTFKEEDDFYAWAEHPLEGTVKGATVVSKGDINTSEDQLWLIIERNGVNCLEKLAPVFKDNGSDNYKPNLNFLDSHVRFPSSGYLESPLSTVSVPDRLVVDDEVRLVVDGVDLGNLPVTETKTVILPDGVTIEKYALVGLPYIGVLQGNPIAYDSQKGNAYGDRNRVVDMQPYVHKSLGYKVGMDDTDLQTVPAETSDSSLYTGFMTRHTVKGAQFSRDDVPIIVQDKAYPLTIVSVVYNIELN